MAQALQIEKLITDFGGRVAVDSSVTDVTCLSVETRDLVELCYYLRDDETYKFNFMADICAVDFHPKTPRFQLVYQLFSIPYNWRIRLKCALPDPPVAPTIIPVWTTANWHEREAYDMYGIVFEGHPDLRRIYMWKGFDGYPMRKDYPLQGYADDYNPHGAKKDENGGIQ